MFAQVPVYRDTLRQADSQARLRRCRDAAALSASRAGATPRHYTADTKGQLATPAWCLDYHFPVWTSLGL